jgi:hypothetical protein
MQRDGEGWVPYFSRHDVCQPYLPSLGATVHCDLACLRYTVWLEMIGSYILEKRFTVDWF